jgi:hypothetical protein
VIQFDILLSLTVSCAVQVTFRNMYHQRRKFVLATSNAKLIKLTSCELHASGLESRNFGIQIDATNAFAGQKDVLLFINDDENRTEVLIHNAQCIHRIWCRDPTGAADAVPANNLSCNVGNVGHFVLHLQECYKVRVRVYDPEGK